MLPIIDWLPSCWYVNSCGRYYSHSHFKFALLCCVLDVSMSYRCPLMFFMFFTTSMLNENTKWSICPCLGANGILHIHGQFLEESGTILEGSPKEDFCLSKKGCSKPLNQIRPLRSWEVKRTVKVSKLAHNIELCEILNNTNHRHSLFAYTCCIDVNWQWKMCISLHGVGKVAGSKVGSDMQISTQNGLSCGFARSRTSTQHSGSMGSSKACLRMFELIMIKAKAESLSTCAMRSSRHCRKASG